MNQPKVECQLIRVHTLESIEPATLLLLGSTDSIAIKNGGGKHNIERNDEIGVTERINISKIKGEI